MRRAVITGIGVVSPIGIGVENFWEALISGQSGIRNIDLFDVSTFPCQIAGQISWDVRKELGVRANRFYARGTQFGVRAARLAMQDAGLQSAGLDPYNTGIIVGTAGAAIEQQEQQIYGRGANFSNYKEGLFDPLALTKGLLSAPVSAIAYDLGIAGYCATESATCPSALYSLATAALRINAGLEDLLIVGGVDAPINRSYLASLCAMHAVATDTNHDPHKALKPFDDKRTRSVLAEGAALFIVETYERAMDRGANIYCSIPLQKGFQQENINELYFADKSGSAWANLIKNVRKRLRLQRVDCIMAHAPSDSDIDLAEARALNEVFGKKLKKIPITSIKAAIGSGFAAAGAMQVAASALAIKKGLVPPTLNFRHLDKRCNLLPVSIPVKVRLNNIMILAHGQGGNNACLVLKKERIR